MDEIVWDKRDHAIDFCLIQVESPYHEFVSSQELCEGND